MRYHLAADILLELDQILGPDRRSSNLALSLDKKAKEIAAWLEMRREECPTWVPDVTPSLTDVIDRSISILVFQ